MKKLLFTFVMVAFGISLKADTAEEFLATYRSALEQKDAAKLLSLFYTNGCSEADLLKAKRLVPMVHFYNGKLTAVKFEPFESDRVKTQIADGKKYEPTYSPQGGIKFYYDSNDGNSHYNGGDAYAVIDGQHRLIGFKSSDLGWKGPQDHQMNFGVVGSGQDKVKVYYKWNVSGVDQERVGPNPGGVVVLGQYFESIKVTSEEDDVDVVLTVSEGGKEIYKSQPLKGKGIIEYKRGQ
jgi:hypothetical protein